MSSTLDPQLALAISLYDPRLPNDFFAIERLAMAGKLVPLSASSFNSAGDSPSSITPRDSSGKIKGRDSGSEIEVSHHKSSAATASHSTLSSAVAPTAAKDFVAALFAASTSITSGSNSTSGGSSDLEDPIAAIQRLRLQMSATANVPGAQECVLHQEEERRLQALHAKRATGQAAGAKGRMLLAAMMQSSNNSSKVAPIFTDDFLVPEPR